MDTYINTDMHKSDMYIPTYAGLLSVNVTLLLCIETYSLSNTFCDM